MTRSIRIGVLTPSSNTALEPLTSKIVATLPDCSAHFARFKVTQIALSDQALGQFDDSKILAAAELLADAKLDVITWSGTAAGWMGFETDELLCRRITERTGIPASTAVLALNDLIAKHGIKTLGLVSPYTQDVQEKIIKNYREIGVEIISERHENISVNHDFALVTPERLNIMMKEVAKAGPDAITTYCTNLRAAQLAPLVERELGIPLLDTVSTTIWGALKCIGEEPSAIKGWGQLFEW